MAQLIKNGPDIPESLLHLVEEGQVIFFCGAGISYRARLPGFHGLVEAIYNTLHQSIEDFEADAIKNFRYDIALGLLEKRMGRPAVRKALESVLQVDSVGPSGFATHAALLKLSKCRKDGATRIITTNFDRLFVKAAESLSLNVPEYLAPMLPVPKRSRWNGLVYLHGQLPKDAASPHELERLILTSGDFGQAYLTERWAARFVSDLFKQFTVCFVGYSVNDPVLRYMTDALAADKKLGEKSPEMFVFANEGSDRAKTEKDWRAKEITAILYGPADDHAALHDTLGEWSSLYEDGAFGKARIVSQHRLSSPRTRTVEDDFVRRMIWALTDLEGVAAKRFAGDPESDPVAPLDWLEPLCERTFKEEDLARVGVGPLLKSEPSFGFSLLRRPGVASVSPMMAIVLEGLSETPWDMVMIHLGHWLLRHIGDPRLLLWFTKAGGRAHNHFEGITRRRLEELDKLATDGETNKLNRIRKQSKYAIPCPAMRRLWDLFFAGSVRESSLRTELYSWVVSFRRHGLTLASRTELKQLLSPRLTIREPYAGATADLDESTTDPSRVVSWDLVLASDQVHHKFGEISNLPTWQAVLPDLLDEFVLLLRDALALLEAMGSRVVSEYSSSSYQPSISKHPQNRDFRDWTILIELVRDAYDRTAQLRPDRAAAIARDWATTEQFSLFRRLALYAAMNKAVVAPSEAMKWLLADDGKWLWAPSSLREVCQLLRHLGASLRQSEVFALQRKILKGPPIDGGATPTKDEVERDAFRIALRLAKIEQGGGKLTAPARRIVGKIYPDGAKFSEDDREEFSFWMGPVTDWPEQTVPLPSDFESLVTWLKEAPALEFYQDDDWVQLCRARFQMSLRALSELARQNVWRHDRWKKAMQVWSEDKLQKVSWRRARKLLLEMPDHDFVAIQQAVAWWLRSIGKSIETGGDDFLVLCQRIIDHAPDDVEADDDEPVASAINRPIGHVAQALIDFWSRNGLKDEEGLPEPIRQRFHQLCDRTVLRFRHGRTVLAAQALVLFRVDQAWFKADLLPCFDWNTAADEARGCWQSYLGAPRAFRPFLEVMRQYLLETADHYDELGMYAEQFASFLAFVALSKTDVFAVDELRQAIRKLPDEGLEHVFAVLMRTMEGGEQQEQQWGNRVLPFWQTYWPADRVVLRPRIAEDLARLLVTTGELFPRALQTFDAWISTVPYPDYFVQLLAETSICPRFPRDALIFLGRTVARTGYPPSKLKTCLDQIATAAPDLVRDPLFLEFRAYLESRNTGA